MKNSLVNDIIMMSSSYFVTCCFCLFVSYWFIVGSNSQQFWSFSSQTTTDYLWINNSSHYVMSGSLVVGITLTFGYDSCSLWFLMELIPWRLEQRKYLTTREGSTPHSSGWQISLLCCWAWLCLPMECEFFFIIE
jgi:hypothetical protein